MSPRNNYTNVKLSFVSVLLLWSISVSGCLDPGCWLLLWCERVQYATFFLQGVYVCLIPPAFLKKEISMHQLLPGNMWVGCLRLWPAELWFVFCVLRFSIKRDCHLHFTLVEECHVCMFKSVFFCEKILGVLTRTPNLFLLREDLYSKTLAESVTTPPLLILIWTQAPC